MSNFTLKGIMKSYYTSALKQVKITKPTNEELIDKLLKDYSIYYSINSKLVMSKAEYASKKNSNKELLIKNKYELDKFNSIASKFDDNDVLSNFTKLSELQQYVKDNYQDILINQANCFTASCGDGKTIATIYLMSKLGLRTLIISTRNAVNDQWLFELSKAFPKLKIVSRIDADNKTLACDYDVMICTPQYLYPKINGLKDNKDFFKMMNFDLFVYDELHSLLSDQFSLVLALPYLLKINKVKEHVPMMIGLTASLPNTNSKDYKIIEEMFGTPIRFNSNITQIPVYFTDFRDTISEEERGFCDSRFHPMDDYQSYDYYKDMMLDKNIKPTLNYKLIIISSSIDSSVFCGLKSCLDFKTNTLAMRAITESNLVFNYNKLKDVIQVKDLSSNILKLNDTIRSKIIELNKDNKKFDSTILDEKFIELTYDNISKLNLATKIKKGNEYIDYLPYVGVISGTYHRLKEGFNCKNIVYGICTKFIWSDTSRVQILGRIRRSSTDEKLNKHTRLFFVSSGKIPSNMFQKYRQGKHKIEITYDLNYEEELFKKENYVRITESQIKPKK